MTWGQWIAMVVYVACSLFHTILYLHVMDCARLLLELRWETGVYEFLYLGIPQISRLATSR